MQSVEQIILSLAVAVSCFGAASVTNLSGQPGNSYRNGSAAYTAATIGVGGVASGHKIVIFAWADLASTSFTADITRSGSHLAGTDCSTNSPISVAGSGETKWMGIRDCDLTVALQSGDLVRVTPAVGGQWRAFVYDMGGNAAAPNRDQTGTGAATNASQLTITASNANTQANDIVFIAVLGRAAVTTWPSGYTQLDVHAADSNSEYGITCWKEISNSETSSVTITLSAGGHDIVGAILTYKEPVAGGASPVRRQVVIF